MNEILSEKNFSSLKCPIFEDVKLEEVSNELFTNEMKKGTKDAKMAEKEPNSKNQKGQETFLIKKFKKLYNGDYRTIDFLKLSKKSQIEWLRDYIKSEEEGIKNNLRNLPDNIIDLIIATVFEGDCGNSTEEKPDWLDIKKFQRGQKFAMDNFFGMMFSQLLSLFILFSFEEGIKPLILTGKSSTPYTAFKRYVSTVIRMRNWYSEDPWTKGTPAHKDIITVRKMHSAIRKRLKESNNEEINAASSIENPFCSTREILNKDFQSSCPVPFLGQCPYMLNQNPQLKAIWPKGLNQSDMVATQFGFVGLLILYPTFFGAHNATSEDLDAFVHVWRGIGYLLGMDDEFNLCRGSLAEVKQRCKDFLKFWAIPNFRNLSPECEHLLRCVVEGIEYYTFGPTYEMTVLYLSEILQLRTPGLYSSLTYKKWMTYNFFRIYLQYGCQVPAMKTFLNNYLNSSLDKAMKLNAEDHENFKKRSEQTLENAMNLKKDDNK